MKWFFSFLFSPLLVSPSVWREWIEIRPQPSRYHPGGSPSVWREWIEITSSFFFLFAAAQVSLRVEGVD